MMTNPPILRNSLLALPLLGAGGAFSGGVLFGVQVLAAGLVAIGNLALLSWLTGRVTTQVARGDDPGLSGVLITLKLVLNLPVFLLLLQVVDPLATVIGFTTVVLGVVLTGLTLAFVEGPGSEAPMAMES